MDVNCKVCGKEFTSKGLHTHIIKAHDLTPHAYYETYYPRYDKLTGEQISYTDYHSYFDTDFSSKDNMTKWLKTSKPEDAKAYMLGVLKKRIDDKELKYAPSFVELETTEMMPPYKAYVYFFGSFTKACELIGVEPLFRDDVELPSITLGNPKMLIDTREQQPLEFKNSVVQKLSIGDYTFAGEDYSYTYVDRKSEGDFKSTVTVGTDRFLREIDRVNTLDSYLYIVVESSIKDIQLNNNMAAHKSNMKYVWASMRRIQHHLPRKAQFVFTGSRKKSELIIPYLLKYGKTLWSTDVQYILTKKGII